MTRQNLFIHFNYETVGFEMALRAGEIVNCFFISGANKCFKTVRVKIKRQIVGGGFATPKKTGESITIETQIREALHNRLYRKEF